MNRLRILASSFFQQPGRKIGFDEHWAHWRLWAGKRKMFGSLVSWDEYGRMKSLTRWFCRMNRNKSTEHGQPPTNGIHYARLFFQKELITQMHKWDGSLTECNEFSCAAFSTVSSWSTLLKNGACSCALVRIGMWQTIWKSILYALLASDRSFQTSR